MTPNQKVETLPGIGPISASALRALGVQTVGELVRYLPSRLEDRSRVWPITELPIGEDGVIRGVIQKVSTRRSQRGVQIVQATLADDSGRIDCLWFNQRYLLKYLRAGQSYFLFGQKRLAPTLHNPFFVKKIINQPEICPIYPTNHSISQASWRKFERLAQAAIDQLPDILPVDLSSQLSLSPLAAALTRAHWPQTPADLADAYDRLAWEELLILALATLDQKRRRQDLSAVAITPPRNFLAGFQRHLPFQLTAGQCAAVDEILADLRTGRPLRRLLYGEVGSGKTAVAAAVAAAVLARNQRVMVVAPTTTLAAQQADRLRQFLPARFRVGLLTGARKEAVATADCLVATHAALYAPALGPFGLVVIDEQQRFGVEQRQKLLDQAAERHVLMMSATPIPRSLAQTVFGAVDITYIRDRLSHQQPVVTRRFTAANRSAIEKHIEDRLNRGEPGYVICGLISEPTTEPTDLLALERKTVMGEAKRLMKRFPGATFGVLHGRLIEADKQKIVSRFQAGQITILIATTVVEVGIDNPLASWMLVEDADHFGLGQLHQLRGRIGRGHRASICFLADSQSLPLGTERLKLLEKIGDGLTLAEHDLRLRGPGELIGQTQSGLPALRYARWDDLARLRQVFAIAQQLLDDGLERYPALARAVRRYGQDQTEVVI